MSRLVHVVTKHRVAASTAIIAAAALVMALAMWPRCSMLPTVSHNGFSEPAIFELRLYSTIMSTEVGWPVNIASMYFTKDDVSRVRIWLEPDKYFDTDVEMIDFERDESHAVRSIVLWLPPLPSMQACMVVTELDQLFKFRLGAHRDKFEQFASQLCGVTTDLPNRSWRKHFYGTISHGRMNVGSSADDPRQIDISIHLSAKGTVSP